jgi:hypothetical protein
MRYIYVVKATSVSEEMSLNIQMRVYPNPSKGEFTIMLDLERQTEGSLTIHDMTGRKVHQLGDNRLRSGEYEIDLTHLSSGVYFIRLESEAGVMTERIVISR